MIDERLRDVPGQCASVAKMTLALDRPALPARTSGRYTGRYPLAVESFALARVAELLPGVTTVTPTRAISRYTRSSPWSPNNAA
jgi:hypothetical protein